MRTTWTKFFLLFLGFFVAAGIMAISQAASPGGTNKTAQGIMVNLEAVADILIDQTFVYKFNADFAATYYNNAYLECTVSGADGVPTATVQQNQPAAPAPDAGELTGGQGVVWDDAPLFRNHGLSDSLSTVMYTKSKNVTVSWTDTKKRTQNITYTFHYAISPKPGLPIYGYLETDAEQGHYSAYELIDVTGNGTANIPVNALIAGESVVQSSNAKIGTKYSFSLLDSYGASRVSGLQVTVDDGVNATPYDATATIESPADFTYTTNAGSNGVTSLLKDGDARTILNNDSFAGNDNGGADGSALALARLDTLYVDLGPGSYSITLSGSVKDNTVTNASISFSVTQNVVINFVDRNNNP